MTAQGEAGGKRTHSIDDEELPTDVVARGTCQEDDGACKVPWLAPPPGRDALRDLAQPHGVLQQLLVPVRSIARGRARGRDKGSCVSVAVSTGSSITNRKYWMRREGARSERWAEDIAIAKFACSDHGHQRQHGNTRRGGEQSGGSELYARTPGWCGGARAERTRRPSRPREPLRRACASHVYHVRTAPQEEWILHSGE